MLRRHRSTGARWGVLAEDGPHGDDDTRALREHDPSRGTAAVKRALQVDGDDAPERFIAHLRHRNAATDPGIGNHQVEPAVSGDCSCHQPVDRLSVGHVAHLTGGAADLVGSCIHGGLVHVGENDRHPITSEPTRDTEPQSLGRASDDGDLPHQALISVHVVAPESVLSGSDPSLHPAD